MPSRRRPEAGKDLPHNGELLDAVNRQVLAILTCDAR